MTMQAPRERAARVSVPRKRCETLELLREKIEDLEISNRVFDEGRLAESKRIALAVRVLLHHRPQSKSRAVINQLDLQQTLTWVDTAGVVDPTNLASTFGLTMLRIFRGDREAEYRAMLGDYPPFEMLTASGGLIATGSRIPFDEWWNNSVIKDAEGQAFSRRQLVLALTNKEGGAHVDPEPDEAYAALAAGSLGWRHGDIDGDDAQPLKSNPAFPAMRQIGYEVYESLRQQEDKLR